MKTLKELRKEKGKTLKEVADDLGIKLQELSRWEVTNLKPNLDNVDKLLEYYKVKYEDVNWRG